MDRIAALRTVEEALGAFERGEIDLETMESRIRGTLRTYATEYEDGTRRPYRATGEPSVEGLIVIAESPAAARERIEEIADTEGPIEVEALD